MDSFNKLVPKFQQKPEIVLREKIKGIQMNKGENIASYLTKITQVRGELGIVREVVQGNELVQKIFNGVANPWAIFVESVVARENMSS